MNSKAQAKIKNLCLALNALHITPGSEKGEFGTKVMFQLIFSEFPLSLVAESGESEETIPFQMFDSEYTWLAPTSRCESC